MQNPYGLKLVNESDSQVEHVVVISENTLDPEVEDPVKVHFRFPPGESDAGPDGGKACFEDDNLFY